MRIKDQNHNVFKTLDGECANSDKGGKFSTWWSQVRCVQKSSQSSRVFRRRSQQETRHKLKAWTISSLCKGEKIRGYELSLQRVHVPIKSSLWVSSVNPSWSAISWSEASKVSSMLSERRKSRISPQGEQIIWLSLIHIWRCRRSYACRSRWSPYH